LQINIKKMKKYLLKKDWFSKRHNKIITSGTYVIIKIKEELKELIDEEYIDKPKKAKKKNIKK